MAVVGKKPQALLAYLAANAGRPQPRDQLAALLWGERFDEQARQSLRQAISKLRKVLGGGGAEIIKAEGDELTLDADVTDVDARIFESLAKEDTPEALAQAARLYEGGFLEGLEVREKGFEDWVQAERIRFSDMLAGILSGLAGHQDAAGDRVAAVETAKRLVGLDPLNEEGHRTLMRQLAANGQRAQAVKQFQTLSKALRGELDTSPDPETERLVEEIQASEGPVPVPEPDELPPALPDMPSLAVLPFANLSGDPQQEYFSDGITDDLITALSNVRAFFVIGRGSSFTYKGRTVDVREVGHELGVHYVLEGSVRKSGDKVRVSAELIEAATGNHVWADRYDGGLDGVFDLQDEIAASVVGAIEPQIHRAEVERIRHKRPENFDAYDLTLCGLAKMNRLTPKDSADALDPNYARAYACASYCHRRPVQLKGLVISDADKVEAIRLA